MIPGLRAGILCLGLCLPLRVLPTIHTGAFIDPEDLPLQEAYATTEVIWGLPLPVRQVLHRQGPIKSAWGQWVSPDIYLSPKAEESYILNVLVHEAGHSLGLGHNLRPSSVMWPKAQIGSTNPTPLDHYNARTLGLTENMIPTSLQFEYWP